MKSVFSYSAVSAFLLFKVPLWAVMIPITASDSGFINALGRTSGYDGTLAAGATYNYSVGSIDDDPLGSKDVPRKNWFVFDLSPFSPGDITGAMLDLYLPSGGFEGDVAGEDFVLFGTGKPDSSAMATFASELTTAWDPFDGSPGGEKESATALFDELNDLAVPEGPMAIASITEGDEDSMLLLSFSPFGIDYLNMFAGGLVVFGGEIVSLDAGIGAPDDSPEYAFGFTAPDPGGSLGLSAPTPMPVLVIDAIPEPSAYVLIVIAGGFLLFLRSQTIRV